MNRAAPGLPALVLLLVLALPGCGGGETQRDGGSSKPSEPATFANPVYDVNAALSLGMENTLKGGT